jgi:hypothetical protein
LNASVAGWLWRERAYRVGPTAIGVLLALISLPLVVLTFDAVDISSGGRYYPGTVAPASEPAQWTAAASAVLLSAVVAGSIGALAVRRNPVGGAMFTFLLAWLVAVPGLAVLPALLGQHVAAGCVFMSDGPCEWAVTSENLFTGLWSDRFFFFTPFMDPLPLVILAVGVGVWTWLVLRIPTRWASSGRTVG